MDYVELLSATAGAISALLLAYPLIHEIKSSRKFLRLRKATDKNGSNDNIVAIRQHFLNEKLEVYVRFESCTAWGFVLLFLSFVITVAGAVYRISSTS